MTALLMTMGILMLGIAALLCVRALVLPRLRLESHLRSVESYGFVNPTGDVEVRAVRGSLNQRLNGFAESVGRQLINLLPRVPAVRRGELTAAGFYELSREALHGYRALAAVTFPALVLLYGMSHGGLSLIVIALMVVIGGIGWQVPALFVRSRARRRLDEIDRDLPQFIDLLVATIEAGSAFGGALESVTGRSKGPLGAELRLTMRQQNLGIGVERALNDMVERVDTASVRAFVRTVIRAESHGSSIGPVMRHLASDIRKRRRDEAREKIQKAPIKMMFPLALLILPALLLVILFPALYNVVHILSH
jgi:tight adherence protein C